MHGVKKVDRENMMAAALHHFYLQQLVAIINRCTIYLVKMDHST